MGQEIVRIYRPVVERGIWRIRTDKELGELYKDIVIADIKKKIYEWVGHITRMDQGRTVKYLKVKQRETEEGEDIDRDGWKMWRRIYGR
jgi:hypothetical protein